jgi:hypothetical protein
VAYRGFDAVAYYLLADALLATGARSVALVVNLQALTDGWFRNLNIKHPELVAFLGLGRVPEALLLPLELAGVSDASLVTQPALRAIGMSAMPELLRDLREGFRQRLLPGFPAEAEAATAEPPADERGPRPRAKGRAMGGRRPAPWQPGLWGTSPFRHTDLYPDHLRRDAAAVRVLEATVRRLAQSGARVAVVLAPLHVQALRVMGAYERRGIEESLEVIRALSTERGAAIVDLSHFLLEERYFSDAYTHFTAEGNVIVAAEALQGLATARRPGS